MNSEEFAYIKDRLEPQIDYFDKSATRNKKYYETLKSISVMCSVLTTLAIAIAFVFSHYTIYIGIFALISSTIVLGTYQWEEFRNYGAKWEKFRLVAEQLKSEKYLFLNNSGRYTDETQNEKQQLFVNTIENILRGTDINYFTLLVDPGKRIEKRLEKG